MTWISRAAKKYYFPGKGGLHPWKKSFKRSRTRYWSRYRRWIRRRR